MRARRLAIGAWAALASLLLIGSLAPAPAAASGSGSGGVLVVGDSLEVLTVPYLQRYLPGVTLTTNAVGGYNSYQIYDLFQESYEPSQSVIVFDAGTNDNPAYPQILAGNLAEVAAQVGERCMVVPTVHGYTVNGVDNDGKNRTVRSFAASRPGTQVPDWAGAVAAHPELLQSDGLHPTAAGAKYRAQLIAQGIEGCLAYSRSAAPEATISAAPDLSTVDRFARREAAVAAAIAGSLAEQLALQVAGEQPWLPTAVAMVSPYA